MRIRITETIFRLALAPDTASLIVAAFMAGSIGGFAAPGSAASVAGASTAGVSTAEVSTVVASTVVADIADKAGWQRC
jgi:hypothetical protein